MSLLFLGIIDPCVFHPHSNISSIKTSPTSPADLCKLVCIKIIDIESPK